MKTEKPGMLPDHRRTLRLALAVSVCVLPALLQTVFAQQSQDAPESREMQDARHETRISTTYSLNPYLRGSELSVEVVGDTAVLSGTVPDGVHRELAEAIALAEGIDEVDNRIEVQEDFVPEQATGDRSYAEVIEDAGISAAIKGKLVWSRYTEGLSTSIDTFRGHVTLEGTAVSEAAKDLAGLLARNTNGVTGVTNNIMVEHGDAEADRSGGLVADIRGATDDAGGTLSDAWITMKVKSTLLYSDNISGSSIDVSTEDGVVTLGGVVGNGSEHELAVRLASNVRGVKEVIAQDLTY